LGDGVVFQNKTLRELWLVAGLWLSASAAMAAPQPGPVVPAANYGLPPPAYIEFCQRKPLDCGADSALVLADAARASRERAELMAMIKPPAPTAVISPAALTRPAAHAEPETSSPPAWGELQLAVSVTVDTAAPASVALNAPLIDLEAVAAEHAEPAPAMTPGLWALLNRVNGDVNRAIVQQSDLKTYGVEDYWNTPLEDGRRYGDCEDYVLEKERALVAAGVPRRALNIAVVVTRWGEGHAVLLVDTAEGEYVLDSLSPVVTPWREAPYQWVKRQVNGEAFHWAMVDRSANTPPEPPRLLIAQAR
jgi:predicted transglutaminase-like cysteine proteinase